MSGDHGYDPFGLGEPNPAMEAATAEITELQGEVARLREENERLADLLAAVRQDRGILRARITRLEKALEFAKDAPKHTQEWLRKNDIKFTNLKSHWQKVGFSIYTDLCEVADTAVVALEESE